MGPNAVSPLIAATLKKDVAQKPQGGYSKNMKLEIGKYYRTRDGRKVGPLTYNTSEYARTHPFRDRETLNSYTSDGSTSTCGALYPQDIVAEWTDLQKPSSTVELSALSDEQVIQRFNELVRAGRVEVIDPDDQRMGWTTICPKLKRRLKPPKPKPVKRLFQAVYKCGREVTCKNVEGAVVVDREKLAKALKCLAQYFVSNAEMDCFISDLAKALGLPEKEEK